jgi:FkbM family methyltransferase
VKRWGVRLLCAASLLSSTGSCGDGTDFDKLLLEGEGLYAQEKQELIIRHFFRDRRDGFYLDVGCYHPKQASTTYYLENHLGWSGIGIDAQEKYRPLWETHRPRSKFFAYVVTDESGKTVTFHQAGAISSTEVENIEKWEKLRDRVYKVAAVELPTITLDDLLQREGVEKVDFLSIDINGTEPTAMAGFDIQRYRPDLVHIEVHTGNQELLMSYFEKNGYRRIDEYLEHDLTNWYFTPAEG